MLNSVYLYQIKTKLRIMENKSRTIIEKFNDKGIEAVASIYAKRDNLSKEEKKTIVDILEVLAFNDKGSESERAMEIINKY